MKESVMLVNASGQTTGTMDKIAVHRAGLLHRAFSIFLFNQQGQLLLQQRAMNKYHSGGLWTNTCCSHPRPGEPIADAAYRRLQDEMGMVSDLAEVFQFTYRHEFENGLIEHEYDHVFIGTTDDEPKVNPAEVAAFWYEDIEFLLSDITNRPERYTAWLKISLERVLEYYQQIYCL